MKRVLINIQTTSFAGRSVLEGVLRYTSGNCAWNIDLSIKTNELTGRLLRQAPNAGYDGILVNHTGTAGADSALLETSLPVATVELHEKCILNRRRNTASVWSRNDLIGEIAARHFLSLGRFKSYVFYSTKTSGPWSEGRWRGFRKILKSSNITPAVATSETLDEMLKLPRPIAIMAAGDPLAVDILTACRQRCLRVPEDVSVIGVDCDPLLCEFSSPTLTSVEPNFAQLGYTAAAALDRMMNARKSSPARNIYCKPRGLRERDSTRFLSPAAALVERAKTIIAHEACRGLSVRDLGLRLGVSARLLSLRFQQHEKHTVREEILNTRLERVKAALPRSHGKLAALASECGFSSANRLAHLFKQRFGLSMREYAHTQLSSLRSNT